MYKQPTVPVYLPLDEDLPGLEGEYDDHLPEDEGHGVALLVQVEGGLHTQVVTQVDAPLYTVILKLKFKLYYTVNDV